MQAHGKILKVGGKVIRDVGYGEGHSLTPVEVEYREGHSKDADRSVVLKNNKTIGGVQL